ncbi:DUF2750 domain-containing protein [Undibacterium fentianense]|uniref:DUF2750 domain-containing protein n=1 Tax=Undibacterium fentianense TaxID=2828728 RepID=A0A941E7I5_9BURK|nr:DUF2750 domain-containing protein [Undibacterium fentianense]MBR7800123.1 DUF2750 domain-containing protein [Undibacterium fentianense]
MSQGISQIAQFYGELQTTVCLYLIKNAANAVLLLQGEDGLVMPIWSSEARCLQFLQHHPQHAELRTVRVDWHDFQQTWLKELKAKHCKLGINWQNQPDLVGQQVAAQQTLLNQEEFLLAMGYLDQRSLHPTLYAFIMSKEERALFEGLAATSRYYLEFGMGGSTLHMIRHSNAQIYSVESSEEWIEQMRRYQVLREAESSRLRIVGVDIGPVGKWGYPVSTEYQNNYPAYSEQVYRILDCTQLDLALIDGRFRVACVLKLVMQCGAGHPVKIVIHDFWNRPQYHDVLRYLDVIAKADTLGVFSIKKEIDSQALARDYVQFAANPE